MVTQTFLLGPMNISRERERERDGMVFARDSFNGLTLMAMAGKDGKKERRVPSVACRSLLGMKAIG
jgi:hypothetical protein